MRELRTEIEIKAPVEKVWAILSDFEKYPEWNPFIKMFEGEPKVGGTFKVTIQQPDSNSMTFKPKCLKFDENREFRWLGSLFFKGLFDGEHIFELIDNGNGSTKFVQREQFNGLLVPMLWKQLDTKARLGFELMNTKLKELAEG